MTNQTNIDYLFKLTSPLAERSAAGPTSPSGRRPPFDDHLVNASASASSSSRSAEARTRSGESANTTDTAYRSHSSDQRAATNEEPSESSAPTDSAANDADAATVDDPQDSAQPTASSADEESSGDVAPGEDENNSEPVAAEELAAAALIVDQSVVESQGESTLEDQIARNSNAENAKSLKFTASSSFDGSLDQHAGNLARGELSAVQLAAEDAAPNLETDQNTSPASTSKRAKRSKSAEAVAGDGKSQNDVAAERRHDANRASAEATANIENVAASRKLKAEKSSNTGRRSARQATKSIDDSGRGTDPSATQRADANATQHQTAPVAVANAVSAQAATSVAAESGEEARQGAKSAGHATEGIHINGRAQRAGATAKGRAHAASPDLPRVDTARFVGRVAKAVQTAQERGGLVQLRLSPPELGSLRLELSMQNGVMTAAVETETPAARQILLDHLPALRDRLAEQNIRIERFDVDVRQENPSGHADPRGSHQEQREHQPQQPKSHHTAGRSATTQAPTSDSPHALNRLTNSELNLLA